MPRGEQVARFYTLIMDLARSRRGVPAATLAARHEFPVRSVYRDLRALEQAGFPVVHADGGRWKLIDGWRERIPFPMPLGQLLALHVARDLTAPLRGTRLAKDLDALWRRLSGQPPGGAAAQGELFPRFRRILATRSQLAIDYSRHSALLETLCRGAETRTTVNAVYYAETRRELTSRRIDPYCLYYDPQLEALYVFARCHLRRAMRTFAVHRFRRATLTERTFTVPRGFSAEDYLSRAFRLWRGENAVGVRLLLDPEVAGWVTERRWHASQKEHRRSGGRVEMEMTVDGTREVRRFILQLGAAVEVLEPEWLRREIASEHAEAARRGAGSAGDFVSSDDTTVSEGSRPMDLRRAGPRVRSKATTP